jgi:hypothetical protein
MNTYSSKRVLLFLSGIHLVYFLAACYFKGILLVDSYGYIMQADNIQTLGTWYAEDWNAPLLVDYFSIRPPFYAWCLIAFRSVSTNPYLLLFVQNGLSVLNCWLVYLFTQKYFGINKNMQRVFLLGLCCYPAQMIHANFVMTEIVFQTILLLLFFAVYKFCSKPNWKTSVMIAVLLSIGLLTKPVSLFLPLIVGGIMCWQIIRHRFSWVYLLVFVAVGMVYSGICMQNKHATGYGHYSSIKSINQLKYNARYTLINAKGELFADSVIANCMTEADGIVNYGERLQWIDAQAFVVIKTYPIAFVKVYCKGILAFFMDPGRFDLYHFFAVEESGTLGLMHEVQTDGIAAIAAYLKRAPLLLLILLGINFCWNTIVFLACCYFFYSKKISPKLRLLIFVFSFYIAAATGPVGVSRYRVPIYPLLLIGVLATTSQFGTSENRVR